MFEKMAMRLWLLKNAIKKAEDQKTAIEMSIKAEMKEAARLVSGDTGEILATWKNSKPRTKFNTAKFQKEYPEIYESYLEVGSPVRTFRLKG